MSGGQPRGTSGALDDHVAAAVDVVRRRIAAPPRVALILGSGLGALAEEVAGAVRIPYEELPGFPRPAVEGHAGLLVSGRVEAEECLLFQGRFHLYEGHPPAAAALPVRLSAALGAEVLVVTNAAGALDPRLRAGDLMLLHDHLNLSWRNPLVGPVVGGEARFPDLSRPYDPELLARTERVALEGGVATTRGVYAAVLGPSYETPAEVRMLRRAGADAVGMSTIHEVVAAAALGLRVLGISLITNPAAGLLPAPVSHHHVVEVGQAAAPRLAGVVRGLLATLRRPFLLGSTPTSL